ncbi:MAG: response regulator [Magnetococcales bacterium]|nr:response regulator [Magnetococcales bacterium]
MKDQNDPMEPPSRSTLLIIDDQPSSIFILGQLLSPEYRVEFATGGTDGLHKARQLQPDLILLDVSMPDMDGYTVCQHLKSEENTRAIPVLFITLLNDPENECHGLQLGALDYITKPFNAETISQKIRNHLRVQQQLRVLTNANQEMVRQAQSREWVEQLTLHDLKSPLGWIVNLPVLLEEIEGTTEAHLAVADQAGKAAYRMLDTINHAMDLYKLENQVISLPSDSIDLTTLLDQLCRDLQPVAASRKVTLRIVDANSAACTVQGAFHLLYSLFGNLLKNAIEASPEQQEVTIRLFPGHTVQIHNHGAVPETIRPHFFEKFVTHGKKQGSGLGAYAASLISRLHKGGITLCAGMEETEIAVQLPPGPTP